MVVGERVGLVVGKADGVAVLGSAVGKKVGANVGSAVGTNTVNTSTDAPGTEAANNCVIAMKWREGGRKG